MKDMSVRAWVRCISQCSPCGTAAFMIAMRKSGVRPGSTSSARECSVRSSQRLWMRLQGGGIVQSMTPVDPWRFLKRWRWNRRRHVMRDPTAKPGAGAGAPGTRGYALTLIGRTLRPMCRFPKRWKLRVVNFQRSRLSTSNPQSRQGLYSPPRQNYPNRLQSLE